jgi:hypothetical protein
MDHHDGEGEPDVERVQVQPPGEQGTGGRRAGAQQRSHDKALPHLGEERLPNLLPSLGACAGQYG